MAPSTAMRSRGQRSPSKLLFSGFLRCVPTCRQNSFPGGPWPNLQNHQTPLSSGQPVAVTLSLVRGESQLRGSTAGPSRRGHPGIPHGTRTHKLRIRGPIPCQFGQGPPGKEFWRQVGTQRRKPENNNFEGLRWEFPRERIAVLGATSAASPAGGGHQRCARSA